MEELLVTNTLKGAFTVLSVVSALTTPVWAATRTVNLDVPSMTCAMCPITVKKALIKVSGVSKIDVSYEQKTVMVTYDDAKTNVQALVKVTTDAGYPSKPETENK